MEEDRQWHNRKKEKVQGAENQKGTLQVYLRKKEEER